MTGVQTCALPIFICSHASSRTIIPRKSQQFSCPKLRLAFFLHIRIITQCAGGAPTGRCRRRRTGRRLKAPTGAQETWVFPMPIQFRVGAGSPYPSQRTLMWYWCRAASDPDTDEQETAAAGAAGRGKEVRARGPRGLQRAVTVC